MDAASLFVSMAFGCVGYGVWSYGRRRSSARHLGIGLLLIGFSWFVDDPWIAGAVGSGLTLLAFWP